MGAYNHEFADIVFRIQRNLILVGSRLLSLREHRY